MIKIKSIGNMFAVLFSIIVGLIIVLCLVGILFTNSNKGLVELTKKQREVSRILLVLRDRFNELSRLSRLYVVTGDVIYEQRYNDVLMLHLGEKSKGKQPVLQTIGEDDDESLLQLNTLSSEQLITSPLINKKEQEILKSVLSLQTDQLKLEQESMNVIKVSGENGEFNNTMPVAFSMASGSSDSLKALQIVRAVETLHSQDYNQKRIKIDQSIKEVDDINNKFFAASNRISGEELYLFLYLGIVLVLIVVCVFGYQLIRKRVIIPLTELGDYSRLIVDGDFSKLLTVHADDETGRLARSINTFSEKYKEKVAFIQAIGKGNFNETLTLASEKDEMGKELLSMHENLKERSRQDEQRNWATEGIAKFAGILRSATSLKGLSEILISEIVRYMKINQGGIFLLNKDDVKNPYLELMGAYAFERKKFLTKKLELGEGLAGQCVLEGQTIYLKQIPEDYVTITSGLGDAPPSSLLIVPLKVNDEINGVIEIASFRAFETHEIEFVEKLAENIASTISMVRINERTHLLLEESQHNAEELKSQEEEMRQSMEELEAIQEEMRRKENALSVEFEKTIQTTRMIQNILDSVPSKIYLKDHTGKIFLVNKEVAKHYPGQTVESLRGTTDEQHFGEQAKAWWADELSIINSGKARIIEEDTVVGKDGGITVFKSIKMPFYIDTLQETGILGVQFDITDFVKKRERR